MHLVLENLSGTDGHIVVSQQECLAVLNDAKILSLDLEAPFIDSCDSDLLDLLTGVHNALESLGHHNFFEQLDLDNKFIS